MNFNPIVILNITSILKEYIQDKQEKTFNINYLYIYIYIKQGQNEKLLDLITTNVYIFIWYVTIL
jgi:hypothetical protein